jgi:hypothetical protein
MTSSLYPCLQCGRLSEGMDKYVICECCLDRFEASLADERCRGLGSPHPRRPTGASPIPLSADEVDERLGRLLDDW